MTRWFLKTLRPKINIEAIRNTQYIYKRLEATKGNFLHRVLIVQADTPAKYKYIMIYRGHPSLKTESYFSPFSQAERPG